LIRSGSAPATTSEKPSSKYRGFVGLYEPQGNGVLGLTVIELFFIFFRKFASTFALSDLLIIIENRE